MELNKIKDELCSLVINFQLDDDDDDKLIILKCSKEDIEYIMGSLNDEITNLSGIDIFPNQTFECIVCSKFGMEKLMYYMPENNTKKSFQKQIDNQNERKV